jgi:hypothetical protein
MHYINLSSSAFLTAYPCFVFKKYIGASKFPFRALAVTKPKSWDQNGSYVREIGLGGVDWIRLAQDRYRYRWRAVVSAVMNLRVLAPRS